MPTPSPHDSSTPLISSAEQPQAPDDVGTTPDAPSTSDRVPKTGKWRLFGLGKKKEGSQEAMDASTASQGDAVPQTQAANSSQLKQQSQQQTPELKTVAQPIPVSARKAPQHIAVAASPSRLRSSSPRLHSPASSEIFERSVQEPVSISTLGGELSEAHIPAHVITEDSIPPALEASAQAITSEELNPDDVEIVMSASHQPAAATLENSASHADLTSLNSPTLMSPPLHHERSGESEVASSLHQSGVLPGADDDAASSYGQLDPNDVRRLSFISFKDIVQSEHQHAAAGEIGSRDNLHMVGISSPLREDNRAASPLRSPRSPTSAHSPSGGLTTPPPSIGVNPLPTNAEQSPVRSVGLNSPGLQHGELTIETMSQALRKTASGDLSGVRSAGMSPVGEESSLKDPLRSRTNT